MTPIHIAAGIFSLGFIAWVWPKKWNKVKRVRVEYVRKVPADTPLYAYEGKLKPDEFIRSDGNGFSVYRNIIYYEKKR